MAKGFAIALAAVLALVFLAWMARPWLMGWGHMGPGGRMGGAHMGAAGAADGGGLPRAMKSTFMAGVDDGAPIVTPVIPASLSPQAEMGKRGFEAKCAACHGLNAAGIKGAAPPLVHKIYEPSHHADFAFVMAVKNGVRAHHWPFGDMPPVKGLTQADVLAIAAYVRELQRANGIGVN